MIDIKQEKKWQDFWEENGSMFRAIDNDSKKKKYILVEFPYPSGSGLHIGHAFTFTGIDIYARLNRMKGLNVLFPMGWDAFGLPTENYAIKNKKNPKDVTKENTDMFRNQMKRLAFSFDWSREINTTDPKYYKWTQWIFVQLFKHGLAYKKEMPINWCPVCKIGLANEEVVGGKCERCGAEVSRRNISQWIVKITKYADELIEGLDETQFEEKIKQSQINWIGKSKGAILKFQETNSKKQIEVFTTRPDTLPSATFLVLAPEHPLVSELILKSSPRSGGGPKINSETIKKYVEEARKKSDLERGELNKEKTGVFSGLYVINPYNNKKIPVWISDFVLSTYGTGAIMSVPAQDERDEAFAKKFNLEIVDEENLPMEEALKYGEETCSYHLRDWIFSRQHYWGEPIPMIYCQKCGWQPVPEEDLPVVLPDVKEYEPTETGESPLSKIDSFVKTKCPLCGGEAKRETDTMPNWAGSDWYFLRYIDPNNDTEICSQEKMKYWMPVDIYVGGDEHNTLHLLYSRFIYRFLKKIGVVVTNEPYLKRLSHGVILGSDNQRMSKSRGNVIIPEVVADRDGVDVLRLFLMFLGPFNSTIAWNEKTLVGIKRFLEKFEKYIKKQIDTNSVSDDNVVLLIDRTVKMVGDEIDSFKFNTAIAKIMELLNSLGDKSIGINEIKKMLILIAPMAPYLAEELWSLVKTNNDPSSIHLCAWPEIEDDILIKERVLLPVSINGKVRAKLEVSTDACEEEVLSLVNKNADLSKWLEKKKILRTIYVKGRVLNLVIGS